ncbi:VOC family protein [Pelagibius sp. CAU 1746]|uniref:VOC family protein n=1 Tax=Pelagibius sp. CAU 1746 TaxID=3140370 RepID=UPI00325AE65F
MTETAGSPATPPLTSGVHHVGLTVPDLPQARAFFLDVLGFTQVGEKPDYPAVFVSDGTIMVTLWQAADPQNAQPFDRKNAIGLHHLALQVESGAALETLHRKLAASEGVAIEFAPESLGGSAIRHMMCAIPGGIRVEFIAPQG